MSVAQDKCVSRFVAKYRRSLEAWAKRLAKEPGTVVAISRKGPRLLELLAQEDILPPEFLRRVTTELALPFLRASESPATVTDDGIWWGSTFNRVHRLVEVVVTFSGGKQDVLGLPFAVSTAANADFIGGCVSDRFLVLGEEQVAPFVHDEVTAFRLLGRPFDIEYPTISFAADLSDETAVAGVIEDAAASLGGECVDVSSVVPTARGSMSAPAWTILPKTQSFSVTGEAQLAKLRVYLNAERQRLTVAAMQPIALAEEGLSRTAEYLPGPLCRLWHLAVDSLCRELPAGRFLERDILLWRSAANRSLVMLASFLNGMLLLHAANEAFLGAFADQGVRAEASGPTESDLRLILGPTKAGLAARVLDAFLADPSTRGVGELLPEAKDRHTLGEVIPPQYEASYLQGRSCLLEAAGSEGDVDAVMRAVFQAQHLFIELPGRNAQADPDIRLEFGICLERLREIVLRYVPTATDVEIHRSLDRLIDEGCVVPRYVRVLLDDGPIWARIFRIGEGSVPKLVQTVRLLFEKLSAALGTDRLPKLVFEKFCVLALCNERSDPDLAVFDNLETQKSFHLYGARQALTLSNRVRFLVDWAVGQQLLKGTEGEDERTGQYVLNVALDSSYPRGDRFWGNHSEDALEELARFVAKVARARGLGTRALVLVSSLATPAERKAAVEALLDLWLHDRSSSVYHAIQALGALAESARLSQLSAAQLGHTNEVLARTANFSAQVTEKMNLVRQDSAIREAIGTLVSGGEDSAPAHVWRDLSQTLESRLAREGGDSGFTPILSALRAAYATNRLLRDLLGHAGYVDPDRRSASLHVSITSFRNRIARLDPIVRDLLYESGGGMSVDALAAEVLDRLPCSFPEAFDLVRPVVLEVAERCEVVLRKWGSQEYQEPSESVPPPQYVLMWDVRGSSLAEKPGDLDKLTHTANARLVAHLKKNARNFRPESRDDGNGMVCSTFAQVLTAFRVLVETYAGVPFRAGVEVNMQGDLSYFRESKELGGRAFVHGARMAAMFKEIDPEHGCPNRWSGGAAPQEPAESYLVVGEFAQRFAELEGVWPPEDFAVVGLAGRYAARVDRALPVTVHLVVPRPRGGQPAQEMAG